MMILLLSALLVFVTFGGLLTYLAWFRPEKHLRYHLWFARIHDVWNPEQARWIRSESYIRVMKVVDTLFFLLSLIGLVLVVMQM